MCQQHRKPGHSSLATEGENGFDVEPDLVVGVSEQLHKSLRAVPPVTVRATVRLRALPALVLVPVMLVVGVQMLVPQGSVLVLEQLRIGSRP